MPLLKCQRDGIRGYKYGVGGYCYVGTGARGKALKQAAAVNARQTRTDAPQNEFIQNEIMRRRETMSKTGRTFRRPPKWLFPNTVEIQYKKQLLKYVKNINEQVENLLFPQIPDIVKQYSESVGKTDSRTDGWADNLSQVVDTLKVSINNTTPINAGVLTTDIGEKTSEWNNNQWRKSMKSVLGVDVFQREPYLNDIVKSFSQENVALISSIKDKSVTDIEGMVQRGIKEGQRHETIKKQIQKQFKTTKSRARLIARDQVAKLNGQLTMIRQQSFGIDKYTWRTSQDERVRPTHIIKEGKKFTWDNPPSDTGHPGQDYQCRCTAEPIFEDVEKEITAKTAKISNVKALKPKKQTPGGIIASESRPVYPENWIKTSGKLGSNDGGFYKNPATGESWYIKRMDEIHARNEVAAAKLYKLVGVDVPEIQLARFGQRGYGVASKSRVLSQDAAKLTTGKVPGVADGFGADAWLANWDVVGLQYDNLLIDTITGKAVRIDPGGSLLFRARGAQKGAAFGDEVGEIKTFFDQSTNYQSWSVLKNYDEAELLKSFDKIIKLSDSEISKVVTAGFGRTETFQAEKKLIRDRLKARRDYIKKYVAQRKKELLNLKVQPIPKPKPIKTTKAQAQTAERLGYGKPDAELTRRQLEEITEARQNGIGVPTDLNDIEDQQILFWHASIEGVPGTFVDLKLRQNRINSILKLARNNNTVKPPDIKNLNNAIEKLTKQSKRVKSIQDGGYTFDPILMHEDAKNALNAYMSYKTEINAAIQQGTIPKNSLIKTKEKFKDFFNEVKAAGDTDWKDITKYDKLLKMKSQTGVKSLKIKISEESLNFKEVAFKYKSSTIEKGYQNVGTSEFPFIDENVLKININGVDVILHYDKGKAWANYGRLRLNTVGTSQESANKIMNAIKKLGIDPKPPTMEEAEGLYLSKIAYRMLKTYFPEYEKVIATGKTTAEKNLIGKAFLKKELNLNMDIDKMPGYDFVGKRLAFNQGKIRHEMPNIWGDELLNFEKSHVIHHETYGNVPEQLDRILDSGGQLISTTDKIRRGIEPRGKSPKPDMMTGGAEYVFARIKDKSDAANYRGFAWKTKKMRALDTVSYDVDKYGETKSNTISLERKNTPKEFSFAAQRRGNETIFKNTISLFDDLDAIYVENLDEAAEAIKVLKKHNVTKLPDGTDVSRLIKVIK